VISKGIELIEEAKVEAFETSKNLSRERGSSQAQEGVQLLLDQLERRNLDHRILCLDNRKKKRSESSDIVQRTDSRRIRRKAHRV
jgi:hypothetical protein